MLKACCCSAEWRSYMTSHFTCSHCQLVYSLGLSQLVLLRCRLLKQSLQWTINQTQRRTFCVAQPAATTSLIRTYKDSQWSRRLIIRKEYPIRNAGESFLWPELLRRDWTRVRQMIWQNPHPHLNPCAKKALFPKKSINIVWISSESDKQSDSSSSHRELFIEEAALEQFIG